MGILGIKIGTAEVALVISSGVAVWQLVQYLLQGGRVRVRMRPGILTDTKTLMTGPYRGWSERVPERLGPRGRYNIEVASVTIASLGRTAVTISEFSIDFGRTGARLWHRYTMAPRPIPHSATVSSSEPTRLEPFDEKTYLFDIWSLIDEARKQRPNKAIRVRASVRVAGKLFRRRSPWRHSWRIPPDTDSIVPTHSSTFFETLYRAIWRHLRNHEDTADFAGVVAMSVEPLFDDGNRPTREEVVRAIRDALGGADVSSPPILIAQDVLNATEGRAPEGRSILGARDR